MYSPVNACPVTSLKRVEWVRQENLANALVPGSPGFSGADVRLKMRCGLPSGGVVSAMRYAFEVWGILCHFSAHVAIAASFVTLRWLPMVCGLMISVVLAVRAVSSASCLALWNPIGGALAGNHNRTIFVFGWELRMALIFFRCMMDSSWSSCGDTSKALSTALLEGSAIVTKLVWRIVRLSKKKVSMSRPA